MIKLTDIDKELLKEVADMHSVPQGSFNIRKNGQSIERKSDDEVSIVPKKDKSGIDIFVKPGVKNRSVHIPVIVTLGNFNDLVYNDFYIGDDCDITIIAGCGIDNKTCKEEKFSSPCGLPHKSISGDAPKKKYSLCFGSPVTRSPLSVISTSASPPVMRPALQILRGRNAPESGLQLFSVICENAQYSHQFV